MTFITCISFQEEEKKFKKKVTLPNGNIIEGVFNEEKIEGKGTIFFHASNPTFFQYTGQFLKGEMHGKGSIIWGVSRLILGVLKFKNGLKYEGQLFHGKREGKGLFIISGGKNVFSIFSKEFYIGKMESQLNTRVIGLKI